MLVFNENLSLKKIPVVRLLIKLYTLVNFLDQYAPFQIEENWKRFYYLGLLMDQHSLLIISDFQKPLLSNEATSKRIKWMNEWMNEWMKLFSWQSLHLKDFTMIIDFRKPRLEAIWRWLINNGIWPHSKDYAADISKTGNAFSLPESRSAVRSSLLCTRKVMSANPSRQTNCVT